MPWIEAALRFLRATRSSAIHSMSFATVVPVSFLQWRDSWFSNGRGKTPQPGANKAWHSKRSDRLAGMRRIVPIMQATAKMCPHYTLGGVTSRQSNSWILFFLLPENFGSVGLTHGFIMWHITTSPFQTLFNTQKYIGANHFTHNTTFLNCECRTS